MLYLPCKRNQDRLSVHAVALFVRMTTQVHVSHNPTELLPMPE